MPFEWTDKALLKTIMGDLSNAEEFFALARKTPELDYHYFYQAENSVAKAIATLRQYANTTAQRT